MFRLLGAGGSVAGSWPCDDRFLVLPRSGIIAVGRGQGPTYGGYHRPTRLDLGVQDAIDRVLCASSPRTEALLAEAFRGAHGRPLTPEKTWVARREHPAWTLTMGALQGFRLYLAHVGVCRAYHWSHSFLRCLTTDHSIEAQLIAGGGAASGHFCYTESRVLGVSVEPPTIDTLSITVAEGDMLVLLTPGVWAAYDDNALSSVLGSAGGDLDVIVQTLLDGSHRNRGLGTTVAVARVVRAGA